MNIGLPVKVTRVVGREAFHDMNGFLEVELLLWSKRVGGWANAEFGCVWWMDEINDVMDFGRAAWDVLVAFYCGWLAVVDVGC